MFRLADNVCSWVGKFKGITLEHLDISCTEVTNLTGISMEKMDTLDLSYTAITNINELSSAKKLSDLWLYDVKVDDLSCLKDLKLERLCLSYVLFQKNANLLRSIKSLKEIVIREGNYDCYIKVDKLWKLWDEGLFRDKFPNETDGVPLTDWGIM